MKMRTWSAAFLLSAAAWTQACGDDDAAIPGPDQDGGADSGPRADASPPPRDAVADSPVFRPDSAPPPFDGGRDADADAGPITTLDGGACDGGTFTVSAVSPQFGATTATTPITISGAGFVSTPRVFLIAAGGNVVQAANAAFVSSSSVTAIVPTGLALGKYSIAVVNPGECSVSLAGSFDVVAKPAPLVLSVSPAQGTTQDDVPVTITGCYLQPNTTLSTLNAEGTVALQTTSGAPVAGAADARCNGETLFTLTGTVQTKTRAMTAGAYVLRLTNPTDGTFGEYSSFVVTNPSGNLTGGWQAGPTLVTGRRSLAVATARVDDANRFIYAIGGENAAGEPLRSVEVASIDRFGRIGAWSTARSQLTTARSGLAVVQRGLYLYAIGGTSSTNGTAGATPTGTPLASIERAKILQSSGAPKLAAPVTTAGTGTLAAGAYYYRVAAVLSAADPATQGESLPSEEVVAILGAPGQTTLTWTAPTVGTATHYRVYRTAGAGGASGEEVLLADNVAATTYVDTGAQTAGTEKPLALGATGPWVAVATGLAHARLDTAATIAPDPTGALHAYVLGGWGQCAAAPAAPMNCYEHASLSDDGATLGAFTSGVTTLGSARMRFGVDAMTAVNGPSGFADAGPSTAYVVVAGGRGISAQASTVEHAAVLAGGALGTWSNPGGFSSEHDGTQLLIANGYGYALFGGTAPNYSQTVDQSAKATVTTTTIAFANWNNGGANLATKVGRHAAISESAYFYVVGGTTNDADALATVYQIIH